MPHSTQPRIIWQETRRRIWERDQGMCQYPYGKHPVALEEAHIDHIRSGLLGTNDPANLRTLCPYHHALRADSRHRGLTAWALRKGILPANWRELIWDEPSP
jgi:5-methylcytosine-specific restriction enzyme A